MVVARRYFVSGRVQGVGFRFFVEDVARREGVSGYVRNLADGRVEALVEGDVMSVGRVEAALWQGPRGARVDAVTTDEVAPSGRATGFRISGGSD
jgi:acylphosphatase